VRFVEDDWESPTLGAWGLGWEVWLDGMEITQFTYFQQVGGLDCKPVLGEITYGLERLAMYLQGKENVYDLVWTPGISYGDVYHQNEVEQSKYNFEASDATWLLGQFNGYEAQAKRLIEAGLPLPGYEMVLNCSTRAARSRSPSVPPTSGACERWRSSSRKPITSRARSSGFRWSIARRRRRRNGAVRKWRRISTPRRHRAPCWWS
jgi:hypothetical protein